MQLSRGRLAPVLGLLTAELLMAAAAHGQTLSAGRPSAPTETAAAGIDDDTESDLGKVRVNASILFYKEDEGRVQAVEPVVSATYNSPSGNTLTLRLTSDTLTGATPIGAAPSSRPQTFERGTSLTGASARIVIPPNTLPLDPTFKDQRYAVDGGYSFLAAPDTRLSLGGAYSHEHDFVSWSGNLGVAQDLNQKNTTVSLSANLETDRSKPLQRTPPPLTMIGDPARNGPFEGKTVLSLVGGVTQVVSRSWLLQLNYSYGRAKGYQNDPYRLVSVVSAGATGGGGGGGGPGGAGPGGGFGGFVFPPTYLYEGRPPLRVRQSVYVGTKGALGFTVLDVSARAYKDSWGVKSITLQVADRLPLGRRLYVEPVARYYRQEAADFFRYYLVRGQPLPKYASADIRLGKFHALTLGLKWGLKLGQANEIYARAEYYRQRGGKGSAGAPGEIAHQDFFPGTGATSVIVGYSFAFD